MFAEAINQVRVFGDEASIFAIESFGVLVEFTFCIQYFPGTQ